MGKPFSPNYQALNFGLGSRDIHKAGHFALKQTMESFSSIATMDRRWDKFCGFLKENFGVRDMRKITRDMVLAYGRHLAGEVQSGNLATATAHNYVSVVNRILEYARQDRELKISAVRDTPIEQRCHIARENRAASDSELQQLKDRVSERTGSLLELQRCLGLRFEESAKLNAKKALAEATRKGHVTIIDGTKGGKARQIPIRTQGQFEALLATAAVQGRDRSMIPAAQSYKQFQSACYREIRGRSDPPL